MNPELTAKLYVAFPHLYRGHTKNMEESSMCWGFQCGDGWYQLLFDLSQTLSDYTEAHPELDIEVVEVKSKFGDLRFSLGVHDEGLKALIDDARTRAATVCELTGSSGQLCMSNDRRRKAMVLCPEKAMELGFSVVNHAI